MFRALKGALPEDVAASIRPAASLLSGWAIQYALPRGYPGYSCEGFTLRRAVNPAAVILGNPSPGYRRSEILTALPTKRWAYIATCNLFHIYKLIDPPANVSQTVSMTSAPYINIASQRAFESMLPAGALSTPITAGNSGLETNPVHSHEATVMPLRSSFSSLEGSAKTA